MLDWQSQELRVMADALRTRARNVMLGYRRPRGQKNLETTIMKFLAMGGKKEKALQIIKAVTSARSVEAASAAIRDRDSMGHDDDSGSDGA